MERLLKAATPFTAFTVVVPFRDPFPGLVPMATVTGAELLATTIPLASSTCTVTAGVIVPEVTAFEGSCKNAN